MGSTAYSDVEFHDVRHFYKRGFGFEGLIIRFGFMKNQPRLIEVLIRKVLYDLDMIKAMIPAIINIAAKMAVTIKTVRLGDDSCLTRFMDSGEGGGLNLDRNSAVAAAVVMIY